MVASLATELLKLRKRPATWILGGTLVLTLVLFNYVQMYLLYETLREQDTSAGGFPVEDAGSVREFLLPASLPENVTLFLAQFGGPIALILGALIAGSEYGWDTVKTALTQGLGRVSVLSSKFLAVAIVLIVFVLLAFGAGAASSYVLVGLLEATIEWPEARDLLQALGIALLILGAWAFLGLFFAVLFRGTALSIGLGLVYGFVLESLIFGLSDQSEVVEAVDKVLLSKNSTDLTTSLGGVPQLFASPTNPVGTTHAVLVLAAYVAVPLLLATLLFRRRDVT